MKEFKDPAIGSAISGLVGGALFGLTVFCAVHIDSYFNERQLGTPAQVNYKLVCYNNEGERVHISRYYPPIDPRGHLDIADMDPDISRCEMIESE